MIGHNDWISKLSNFELIALLFLMASVFYAINQKIKEKEEAENKDKSKRDEG